MVRLRLFFLVSFLFILAPVSEVRTEENRRLNLGILPYFSATKLIEIHKPLVEHLRSNLGVEVSVVSAPNFKQFQERTRGGDYDLVFTAPHFARLADLESGYQRVVMSTHRGRPTFLVKKNGPIVSLKDLKGGKISLPPLKAINHHVALKALRNEGLKPGETVETIITPSHASALLAVLNGQVDVAVMGKSPWGTYEKEYSDRINVLAVSQDFPGFLVMAHPRLSNIRTKEISESLLGLNSTPEGRAYFKNSALEGFAPIDDETMAELDPYVKAIFGVQ